MSKPQRTWSGVLVLALGVGALPLTGVAQDEGKPEAEVVEEDLGDGFRAVSVNGGPPAIIDDETNMIFKEAYGQPIIYDQVTGATLYVDEAGQPVVKGGSFEGQDQRLDRMKSFMTRAQKYRKQFGSASKERAKGKDAKGWDAKGAEKKKKEKKKPSWDAIVALHLELLSLDDEAKLVLEPRLRAVLLKQDEVRRSVTRVAGGPARALPKSNALPPAIQRTLQAFAAARRGGDSQALEQGLAAYRAARQAQDAELARLRERLRELLTVAQEAKLVAAGVLQ